MNDSKNNDDDCDGHPAGPFDPMGETQYCDGSCKPKVAKKPAKKSKYDLPLHISIVNFNGADPVERKAAALADGMRNILVTKLMTTDGRVAYVARCGRNRHFDAGWWVACNGEMTLIRTERQGLKLAFSLLPQLKVGREVLDPGNRVVTIVALGEDASGKFVETKLSGPYAATVRFPSTALRAVPEN